MNQAQWQRKAQNHARCGQIYVVLHHALLLPSILVPPVVSLFDATRSNIKYTVVPASPATALSLGLKLELRAHKHAKVARDYLLLLFDAQNGAQDTQARARQLLREAPMLPACICERNDHPPGGDGEPRES